MYEVARLLIKQGGDINKKIPENYTKYWDKGWGYDVYMYSDKSVIDIARYVYDDKFDRHHPSFGLRNIIENMEKFYNEVEPERLELIKLRERKKHNIEQGPHSLQMSALETFLKNIKDTPIYKVFNK